jgi:hypothetical protein
VTDGTGGYQFSKNETVVAYHYRTAYGGINGEYAKALSNVVTVQVTTIPTQLSVAANLTSVAVNQKFTVSGTLTTDECAGNARCRAAGVPPGLGRQLQRGPHQREQEHGFSRTLFVHGLHLAERGVLHEGAL